MDLIQNSIEIPKKTNILNKQHDAKVQHKKPRVVTLAAF